MDFEQPGNIGPDDHVETYDNGAFRLVTDGKSLLYLFGMRLDFSDALIGGGFQFHNPNATDACGCGKVRWPGIGAGWGGLGTRATVQGAVLPCLPEGQSVWGGHGWMGAAASDASTLPPPRPTASMPPCPLPLPFIMWPHPTPPSVCTLSCPPPPPSWPPVLWRLRGNPAWLPRRLALACEPDAASEAHRHHEWSGEVPARTAGGAGRIGQARQGTRQKRTRYHLEVLHMWPLRCPMLSVVRCTESVVYSVCGTLHEWVQFTLHHTVLLLVREDRSLLVSFRWGFVPGAVGPPCPG